MRIALTYNEKRTAAEREAEFDTAATIEALVTRLARLGHTVAAVEVSGSIAVLVERLLRIAPDVVFDIAEGERGTFREAFYPALFEQLGLAYTGSSPSTRALCLDKQLAERIVAAAGVATPAGAFVATSLGDLSHRALEGPLIVKPNFEGSSKGITAASVVRTEHELRAAVERCLVRYPEGALVERFVEGTDVSVGWVDGLGWLPAIVYEYDAPVYGYELKHVTPERVRYRLVPLGNRIGDAAARAFEALGVRGIGRADFRVTPRGDVIFLELNPLPSLSDGELFAAAEAMGSSADELLACVVASARPVASSRAA